MKGKEDKMVHFLEWQADNDSWIKQAQLRFLTEEYLRIKLGHLELDGINTRRKTWRIAMYELSSVTPLDFDLFGGVMLGTSFSVK